MKAEKPYWIYSRRHKNAKMPKEWDNIVYYNDDGMKLLAYNKTAVILWWAVQHLISQKDELLEIVTQ